MECFYTRTPVTFRMRSYKSRQHAVKGMAMELNFVRERGVPLPLRSNASSAKKTTGQEDGGDGAAGRRRVGKQCCCGMSVCSSLSQTSRVRTACPISYRQNALKMPQASRAVIIEETRAVGEGEGGGRRGEIEAR